jgi:hypothetical protein
MNLISMLYKLNLLCKMTIDERFTENFRFRNIVEGLLHDVALNFLEVLDVFAVGQLVQINSVGLVTPGVYFNNQMLDSFL